MALRVESAIASKLPSTSVYGFLRRRGIAVAEAQDATQGFFVSLLEEDLFTPCCAWQRSRRRRGRRIHSPCCARCWTPLSGESTISHEEAAQQLRQTPEALRVTLHRLRKRFAEVLRETVADTLVNPTEEAIQGELDALRMAFSS